MWNELYQYDDIFKSLVNALRNIGVEFGDKKVETPSQPCPISSTSSNLSLGINEIYRNQILLANERTGIDSAALASLINAEASPNGPNGTWNPNSQNENSTARGLTQFLEGTWLDMARREGTLLNQRARNLGYVDQNNQVVTAQRQQLLELRSDADMSIVTAAELAELNLEHLEQQGVISESISDDERAYYAYLAHHDGAGGAVQIINGTMPEEVAQQRLNVNVGITRASNLVEQHGSAREAYRQWILNYTSQRINPSNFRSAPETTVVP